MCIYTYTYNIYIIVTFNFNDEDKKQYFDICSYFSIEFEGHNVYKNVATGHKMWCFITACWGKKNHTGGRGPEKKCTSR